MYEYSGGYVMSEETLIRRSVTRPNWRSKICFSFTAPHAGLILFLC